MRTAMKPIAIAAFLSLATVGAAYAFDDDYLDRRDTLTKGAGDAQATNAVTQTLDPWPPYARNTDIKVDGKRAELGITRYQQNKSIEPRGLTTSDLSNSSGGSSGAGLTK